MLRAPLLAFSILAAAPALAQMPDMSASDAVSALTEAGRDKLLIADLIGAKITDPSGEAGTLTNLVAVPGGRIVAALVTPAGGGDPVVIPYQLVKIDAAADALGLSLPEPLADLAGRSGMAELGQAVGGLLD